MKERKFKIGDKAKIVKVRNMTSINNGKTYLGTEVRIIGYAGENSYLLEGIPLVWFEDELEHLDKDKEFFDKLVKRLIEAVNDKNIVVEPTSDGGVKIIPLKEDKKENESGIYIDQDDKGVKNVYVVFGGGIHVATGECHGKGNYCIGFQELDEVKECGSEHNEEWNKEKPTVYLIINNKNTIDILQDSLNRIEKQLNKED